MTARRGICPGIAGLLALTSVAASPGFAADSAQFMMQGTIAVSPELAHHIGAQDRLIIKLFHPGENGVEMDAKYQIVDTFALPLEFKIAPSISMSGDTRHKTYVIQVFTDKDRDVLSIATGELTVQTAEPIAVGSNDLRLELNRLRE